ncbi:MAG: response regulator [Bdellovibrionaceae bacterium]|nr:response regulator [Pseudobdellovibrionaceae bacterium]
MAIFIIDDDPHILNLVSGCLEWQGHDVLSFSSPIKAIKTLKTTSPELVILDIDMPKINGFKVLEELRQKRKYIPVIFLTGRSDRLEVIEGLDKGADDYLVKPFDARELMARVAAQWRIKSMRNDLEEANKFLKKLAITDALTQLFIMEQAYKKTENIFKKYNNKKTPAAELLTKQGEALGYGFCMLDLDHFKLVNDGNSHLFGSFVLSEFAKLLKKSLPNTKSFAARYGGDEFFSVIYGTKKEVHRWAEDFRKTIASYIFLQDTSKIQLSTSMGLSFVDIKKIQKLKSTKAQFSKAVLYFSDEALYKSKKKGRNKLTTKYLSQIHFSSVI